MTTVEGANEASKRRTINSTTANMTSPPGLIPDRGAGRAIYEARRGEPGGRASSAGRSGQNGQRAASRSRYCGSHDVGAASPALCRRAEWPGGHPRVEEEEPAHGKNIGASRDMTGRRSPIGGIGSSGFHGASPDWEPKRREADELVFSDFPKKSRLNQWKLTVRIVSASGLSTADPVIEWIKHAWNHDVTIQALRDSRPPRLQSLD